MRELTRDDVTEAASLAVGDRIRAAVKSVLEQILDEDASACRREPVKETAVTPAT